MSADSPFLLPLKTIEIVEQLGLIPHPEGGFFLETHRSGSVPMTSRGGTDLQSPSAEQLVTTVGRESNRQDQDPRRNALTSIYWLPTKASPLLLLCVNRSDHVHYYHGGKPFEYLLFLPNHDTSVRRVILGPDLSAGHQLQVCVQGGTYKCGRLLRDAYPQQLPYDYSLVGEAVGPGFDVADFRPLQISDLEACGNDGVKTTLAPYLYSHHQPPDPNLHTALDFDGFYNQDETQKARSQDRI
jgi:predicted cupin superfamily sugar epimerase